MDPELPYLFSSEKPGDNDDEYIKALSKEMKKNIKRLGNSAVKIDIYVIEYFHKAFLIFLASWRSLLHL